MKTASGANLNLPKLFAVLGCVALGVALWDYPILWPLKLLVVMMHETGHAIAALLMGGQVQRVVISANQAGECLSLLPEGVLRQVVVSSAGYVGSAVAAAGLMIATFRFRARRWVLLAACVWLAAMGALFAGNAFTLVFCLGTAVAFAIAARVLPDAAVDWVNLVLAAFSALYAVMDLRDDLWNSTVRAQSDAAILAQVTFIPSLVWAAVWTALAVAIVLACGVWALRKEGAVPGLRLPSVRPLRGMR